MTVVLQPEARLRVRLREEAEVLDGTLRVTDPAGRLQVIPSARVLVRELPALPFLLGRLLRGLPEGLWTVTVEASDGRRWKGRAAAVAGRTVDVVLE